MTDIRLHHRPRYLSLLASIVLLFVGQGPALAHDPAERPSGHIAIGDSIECGVVFDIGMPQLGVGYVEPFHAHVESVLAQTLDLVNLCELGATSRDVVMDQLFEAAFESRDRDLVVITIGGVGGNSLRQFITSPQAVTCARGNRTCLLRLNSLLNEIEQNLRLILQTLRMAVGEDNPDSAILIRTQYNALVGTSALNTPCANPALVFLARVALEGESVLAEGLNDRIRRLAAEFGARVADIFDDFEINPALISGDCIHPTPAGYEVIDQAFRDAF